MSLDPYENELERRCKFSSSPLFLGMKDGRPDYQFLIDPKFATPWHISCQIVLLDGNTMSLLGGQKYTHLIYTHIRTEFINARKIFGLKGYNAAVRFCSISESLLEYARKNNDAICLLFSGKSDEGYIFDPDCALYLSRDRESPSRRNKNVKLRAVSAGPPDCQWILKADFTDVLKELDRLNRKRKGKGSGP